MDLTPEDERLLAEATVELYLDRIAEQAKIVEDNLAEVKKLHIELVERGIIKPTEK